MYSIKLALLVKTMLIGLALFALPFSILMAQNCQSPIGSWENELGSALVIDSLTAAGEIVGEYRSSTGVDGKVFQLKGWVNKDPAFPGELNISFSVRWEGYGSITSWTGYCVESEGEASIKTIWHLVRPGTEYVWERIITNSSTFRPSLQEEYNR